MAVKSDLTKILDNNRVALQDLQGKSVSWFRKEVNSLRRVGLMRPEALLKGDAAQKSNTIIPGKMYMYAYDALHKDTLPYYDAFPLVIPFNKVSNGFHGINLHYLPYNLRAQLLNRLMQFVSNSTMDEKTKIKFSWAMVSSAAKFAAVKPCVKHYLFSQVASPFKLVHPADWATTILLPVESFVGSSKNKVWRDSLKIIGS